MSIDDLRTKLIDTHRNLRAESELAGCTFNFNDQKIPEEFYSDFIQLARTQKIHEKFTGTYKGDVVNVTEGRQLLTSSTECQAFLVNMNTSKKIIFYFQKIRELATKK